MNIVEIFLNSVKLIINFDKDLFEIISLSLRVSFIAMLISSFFALIFFPHHQPLSDQVQEND